MRFLDLVGRPPPGAPRFLRLITDSPAVTEARLLEWNAFADDEGVTALFHVAGDPGAFREQLQDSSFIAEFELTPVSPDRFYVLIVGRPAEAPPLRAILDAIGRLGLVLLTPVVYRDGRAHIRLAGEQAVLQSLVEALPATFDVTVRRIGTFPDARTVPASALSPRQRAAVEAALEVGYYETPRAATHADVADRLDCASNTASVHLQKAEAKLIRAAMAGWPDAGRG